MTRFPRRCGACDAGHRRARGGEGRLGYFTGAVVRKFGFRILGSPFPGWTTAYMGFNLLPDVPRREALAALEAFALRELRCIHLEIMDHNLSLEDGQSLGFSACAHRVPLRPHAVRGRDLRGYDERLPSVHSQV